MAEVTLNGISKSYGAEVALDNVSMTIPDGAFVVLLGPTGAGKTTTLRMVSGLDKPDTGSVTIGGRDVASYHARTTRCRDGVPAVLALSAPDRATEP